MVHCSVVSSIFMKPPGKAQQPLYGSAPRSISNPLGSGSRVITRQSAVTAGLGYLYVYVISHINFIKQLFHKDTHFSGNSHLFKKNVSASLAKTNFGQKLEEKPLKTWKIKEKCLPLQCQSPPRFP